MAEHSRNENSTRSASAARDERRLRRFGLSTDLCHQVSGAALLECRRAPLRGSAGARGTYAYQGALSELTVQLENLKYERIDLLNLPVFINDDRGKTLILTSGDQFTGLRHGDQSLDPSTRHRKGSVTARAISHNVPPGQAVLGPEVDFEALHGEAITTKVDAIFERVGASEVWIYLMHFDWSSKEIRTEISLPEPRLRGEYLNRWFERSYTEPYAIVDEDLGYTDNAPSVDFPVDPI